MANPLQYSCLGNPMDRGAWQATVHGVAKSQTQLSTHKPQCSAPILSVQSSGFDMCSYLCNHYLSLDVEYGRLLRRCPCPQQSGQGSPSPSPKPPLTSLQSQLLSLPVLQIHKWDYTAGPLLYLSSLVQHSVFETHLCCAIIISLYLLIAVLCLCLSFSRVRPFVTPWTVCSPPGFSVHEISQARILQWVAIPFSRGSVVPFPSRQDVLTHSPPHPRQTRPSSKILLRRGTTETPLLARRSNYVFTFQGNNLFAFGL